MIQRGGAPTGMGPILRAAKVVEGPDASIHVFVPAGPAYERLCEPATLRQLTATLATHLGRPAPIVVELAEGAAESPRITQEKVRQDRLSELIQKEPVIRQAVEELDLELLD
jgi:hypothetical protein